MATAGILVIGGTGTTGRALLAALSRQALPLRMVVRDPQSATVPSSVRVEAVRGDLDDVGSLSAAMAGIKRVFVLTPVSSHAAEWCRNVIAAAREGGVDHVVKLSALGAGDRRSAILRQHGESDEALIASGLGCTILRPSVLFQNLLWQAEPVRTTGQFFLPGGDARLSLVDVGDVAEAAARALTAETPGGGIHELTGPASLSYADVAEQLAAVIGRRVTYVPVPADAAREAMTAAGMPPWEAAAVAELQALAAEGAFARVGDDLPALLGRAPRHFADFARAHGAVFGA